MMISSSYKIIINMNIENLVYFVRSLEVMKKIKSVTGAVRHENIITKGSKSHSWLTLSGGLRVLLSVIHEEGETCVDETLV